MLLCAVGSVSDCISRPSGHEFEPHPGQLTFVEIDYEVMSMAVFPFALIQEGQLSVICENICTKYRLTAS